MSDCKLVYFPVHARASFIRLLLCHANVQYVDEQLSFEEFGKRKAAGEFINGQVPVWIQNGKQHNESKAILRFIGAQHGYYPEDAFAAAQVDAIVDYTNDFLPKLYPDHMKKTHTDESLANYEKVMTTVVAFYEKKLSAQGSKYLCGDKFTIADAMVGALLFAFVYNDHLDGGAKYTDCGKAIIEKHMHFSKYAALMCTECKAFIEKYKFGF